MAAAITIVALRSITDGFIPIVEALIVLAISGLVYVAVAYALGAGPAREAVAAIRRR